MDRRENMTEPDRSVERMTDRICNILDHRIHSIWLYGSVVLEDFRPGWSDIDLLVLTGGPVTEEQARQLPETLHLSAGHAEVHCAPGYSRVHGFRSFRGRTDYCRRGG